MPLFHVLYLVKIDEQVTRTMLNRDSTDSTSPGIVCVIAIPLKGMLLSIIPFHCACMSLLVSFVSCTELQM